jgi:hypothetical protein
LDDFDVRDDFLTTLIEAVGPYYQMPEFTIPATLKLEISWFLNQVDVMKWRPMVIAKA